METIKGLSYDLATLLYPWISHIATGLVACLLVVLAPSINRSLQRLVGAKVFLIRTSVFFLVNAVIFGLLIVWLSPQLAAGLRSLSPGWLLGVLSLSFVFIGVWAERQRLI
ncbi:DUF3392 family protein [Shewanella sp. JM162201]|uniref:DUF3392 family protein n=1 Tax=Shewanella jiangmenensis TaxID=2837387 RepID=A0ABS5V059_9GAMM|nr:DUF3392 family protein [Shewanella jiangmenensis]MBT1443857.1 DUF3392 family protein [Shewanella jiangmenensis]